MVLGLFDRGPLLEDTYADWLFEVYDWALRNFDPAMFRDETLLVTPSNRHFPGKANSAEEMAQLIFDQVVDYAGMKHWPLKLLPPDSCLLEPAVDARMVSGVRGSRAVAPDSFPTSLTVSYQPASLNAPEVMIAGFAHALAHYLGQSASEAPPGGADSWPQVTEVLAVFLGFGLMLANTALVVPRRGCGASPVVQRQAYVSQHDITYALAIFAALKDLPKREVLAHLKKPLQGHFKQALREVRSRHAPRLEALEQYCRN